MVVVESHRAVALVVLDADAVWAIDWQLQVVGAQSMTMSVSVGEQTSLQHLVRARLDSRHQVSWRESSLLDLSEIVVGIAIQGEFADRDEWEVLLGPDLGNVERVVLVLLGLLESHDLQEQVPRREIALGDGVEQVANRVVRIGAGEVVSGRNRQVLDALGGLEMKLAVMRNALIIDQLESVRAIAVQRDKKVFDLFLEIKLFRSLCKK